MDIDSYIQYLKQNYPKKILSIEELAQRNGLVKEYIELEVLDVVKKEDYKIVKTEKFIVYVYNYKYDILKGDILKIRNFIKKENIIICKKEILIKRSPVKIEIKEGIIDKIKGRLIDIFSFKTTKSTFKIRYPSPQFEQSLETHIGKKIIFTNVVFKDNCLILTDKSKIYLVKR